MPETYPAPLSPASVEAIVGVSPTLPQGRLTLTSATPVLTATVSAATTIYYTPFVGGFIPIYDGSSYRMTPFSELSNATAQSSTGSAGPAAVTTNSNYDLFVWSNAGVLTLTRGPLWTSATARGVGAGTTQISLVAGVWTNTVAITNGPGAGLGTYVGTVRSNGSSQIDFIMGAAAAGGTAAVIGVWNAYNRVPSATSVGETTDSWTYNGNAWRSANNSATMRVSVVRGLDIESVRAAYQIGSYTTTSTAIVGVCLDATNTFTGQPGYAGTATLAAGLCGTYLGLPGLGFHFLQATEFGNTTTTFYGDNGAATVMATNLQCEFTH